MSAMQPDGDAGEPLNLTYKQAAAKLNVSMSKLFLLLREGQIRKLELGPGIMRIPVTELEAFQARKKAEQWADGNGAAA